MKPKLSTQQPSVCNEKPPQTMLQHLEARLHSYTWIGRSSSWSKAQHHFDLYGPETKNLHNTNVKLSKASYSKTTSPARSLDKHPPLAALGLGPLDADAGVGQIQALQCAVFLQSFGQYLAVNKHRRDRTWWKRISPLIQRGLKRPFSMPQTCLWPALLRPMWTYVEIQPTSVNPAPHVLAGVTTRSAGAGLSSPSPRPQPLCRQNRSSSSRGQRGSWWTSETPQWPGQNETWPVDSPCFESFLEQRGVEMSWNVSTCINNNGERKEEWGNWWQWFRAASLKICITKMIAIMHRLLARALKHSSRASQGCSTQAWTPNSFCTVVMPTANLPWDWLLKIHLRSKMPCTLLPAQNHLQMYCPSSKQMQQPPGGEDTALRPHGFTVIKLMTIILKFTLWSAKDRTTSQCMIDENGWMYMENFVSSCSARSKKLPWNSTTCHVFRSKLDLFVSDSEQTYDDGSCSRRHFSAHKCVRAPYSPKKMSVTGLPKNGLFGGWACLDEANQAVFVSGLAADLLDWRGGQGLAGDAGSTQTDTLGHTWKLMWRWSFITDKDDTQMANSSSHRNMFAFPLWLDSAHGWPAVLEEVVWMNPW